MNLFFAGHQEKYAVEQTLLTLFPQERPVYPDTPPGGDNELVLSFSRGSQWCTARAVLRRGGKTYVRQCRVAAAELPAEDPVVSTRLTRRTLQRAFYLAAVDCLGTEPPWGMLSGVRPVKLPTRAMEAGASPRQAEAMLRDQYRVSPLRRQLAMDCAQASLDAQRALKEDEVSLYVGIPFCPTRCAYCSFVSADVGRALKLIDPFLDALCRELAATGAMLADAGLRVRTVYFGGGTPTTLSAPQLDRLMGELADHIDLSGCTEYTVEAGRPDTITAEKLAVLARRGCSRVSVNPQTMQDAVLERMRKGHTAAAIVAAGQKARQAGLALSVTAISGLGSRELLRDHAVDTARALSAMKPEYIGLLTLMVEPGTPLEQWVREGSFQVLGPAEILQETALLLDHIDSEGSVFRMNHASNYLTLKGTLNRDLPALRQQVQEGLMGHGLRPESWRAL